MAIPASQATDGYGWNMSNADQVRRFSITLSERAPRVGERRAIGLGEGGDAPEGAVAGLLEIEDEAG